VADRRIVFVIYPGHQSLDLTGPYEVFNGANSVLDHWTRRAPQPRYRLTIAALGGGTVRSESGLCIQADADLRRVKGPIDTLMVVGGSGARAASTDEQLVNHVGRLAASARRVASICTGTFVLAAAALLDDRAVCTHWSATAELGEQFPSLTVDPDSLYRRDGRVWTSAGVTAGIDLSLAMVEADHDARTAQTIARWLVMFLRRPGGQSQFAAPVWHEAEADAIREAQQSIVTGPGDDHRIAALAERVSMSERNFARVFTREVGSTPAKYVEAVRIDTACRLLETTDQNVETVARSVGFGTAETMRRAFIRTRGITPTDHRTRFALSASAAPITRSTSCKSLPSSSLASPHSTSSARTRCCSGCLM
jgi:transcriptional regulator GlxA family with amidase domain